MERAVSGTGARLAGRRAPAARWLASAAVALVLLGVGAPHPGLVLGAGTSATTNEVRTAGAPTFGRGTASTTFGEQIVFRQPVTTEDGTARAEALLEYPGGIGPVATEIPAPGRPGPSTLEYRFLLADNGHILPNTTLVARFRLTGADGAVTTGPPISVTYEDTRFDWRSEAGDIVQVHWYEGGDAFGRRALAIAEEGMARAEELLGVTETDPVDFFVYADQGAFYDALGPGLRENVGGLADSEIRTLFALITPGEIDDQWVGIVIPHELTHLVFDTAAANPYHFWPKWLDEGVATYLSQGYAPSDRSAVRDAARDRSLIPLDALTGQFPTKRERFFLAYSESVSAVDFLVREHGSEALATLINSFADGLSDDEAFEAAIGQTTDAFNASWFADLGADVPDAYGPQPAPPGPLPPAWLEAPAPGASASPEPSGSPGGTAPPGETPGGAAGLGAQLLIALGAVGGIAAVAAGWLLIRRRTASASEGARSEVTSTGLPTPGEGPAIAPLRDAPVSDSAPEEEAARAKDEDAGRP